MKFLSWRNTNFLIKLSLLKEYLLILSGSPRGGVSTWSSLDKYVIKHLDADLAVCTGDKLVQNNSLFDKANYKWIFPEYEDYFDYYRDHFEGTWEKYFNTGRETGLYTSGSIHFAFKDRVLKNYLDVITAYKYIIYTRFDQRYTDYHPKGEEDNILIPEGEDYFGLCDRHAVVPSKYIKKFLSICEFIDTERNLNATGEFNNCETTFKNHLISNDLIKEIKRYERSQFTTSLKGEHTNWRVPKYPLFLFNKLMLKYPDEFLDSTSNLIRKKGLFYSFKNEFRLVLNYYYLILRGKLGNFKRNATT